MWQYMGFYTVDGKIQTICRLKKGKKVNILLCSDNTSVDSPASLCRLVGGGITDEWSSSSCPISFFLSFLLKIDINIVILLYGHHKG